MTPQPQRIVLLDSAPINFGGGYERFLIDIARFATERGHDVTVVTPSPRLSSLFYGLASGRKIRLATSQDQIESELDPARLIAGDRSSTKKAFREADVIYGKNEPQDVALGLKGRRKGRARLIVGFHSSPLRAGDSTRTKIYFSRPYLRMLGRVDGIHLLRRDPRLRVFERAGPRVFEIGNGVDLERFAPAADPLDTDAPMRLLFVGRLDQQKGIDLLCDAIERLPNALTDDFTLTIVGDGPMRDSVSAIAHRSNVTWTPWSDRPQDLYRSHHLLVAPSRWEMYPLVPSEALACGCPVLLAKTEEARIFESCEAAALVPLSGEELARQIEEVIRGWGDARQAHVAQREEARQFALDNLDSEKSRSLFLEMMLGGRTSGS